MDNNNNRITQEISIVNVEEKIKTNVDKFINLDEEPKIEELKIDESKIDELKILGNYNFFAGEGIHVKLGVVCSYNMVMGYKNYVEGSNNVIFGNNCQVKGDNNIIFADNYVHEGNNTTINTLTTENRGKILEGIIKLVNFTSVDSSASQGSYSKKEIVEKTQNNI